MGYYEQAETIRDTCSVLRRRVLIHKLFEHLNLFSDIDECADASLNNCEQECNNLDGTFMCTCRPGFTLRADRRTCEGK